MAYTIKDGDIFSQELMNIPRVVPHGCNAQGKMASGFARVVRNKFPAAYDAYMREYTLHGLTPGKVIFVPVSPTLVIADAITQKFYGYDGAKYVSPEAVGQCFKKISDFVLEHERQTGVKLEIHFPKIGCMLGGGSWEEIEPQILNNVDESINCVLWIK